MNDTSAPSLAYASADLQPSRRWLYQIALACALLPMGVGLITFILWAFLRYEMFVRIGLATIALGTILAAVGFICLGIYGWTVSQSAPIDQDIVRKQLRRSTALLLVNFPLALVLGFSSNLMTRRQGVFLENAGRVTVPSFVIQCGSMSKELAPLHQVR